MTCEQITPSAPLENRSPDFLQLPNDLSDEVKKKWRSMLTKLDEKAEGERSSALSVSS